MADTTLDAIEQRITELVGVVQRLKQEKEAMARQIEDLMRERSEIRERVDTILSRLETVEL